MTFFLRFKWFLIVCQHMHRSKELTSKIVFINWVVMIKFYHHWLQERGVHAIFLITSRKQMSNNYALCFSRIDFVVIPFDIELSWYNTQFRSNPPSQAAYCSKEVPANMFFATKIFVTKAITSQCYPIPLLMFDITKAFVTVGRGWILKGLRTILNPKPSTQ